MPSVDVVVRSPVSTSPRVRQLEGMFDVPSSVVAEKRWRVNAPIEERAWNVGLIVGPSGSGKTTIARHMFGEVLDAPLTWASASVLDDFPSHLSMEQIAKACQSVGFNTIPAWRQPFATLSNGEQFRVSLARRMAEAGTDLVAVDEFTSVVDRQVAKIGAHAVQKTVRRAGGQFVAVTCHWDVEEWLQPDWIIEPASGSFRWRSVQRRPPINVEVRAVGRSSWDLFAPYHYLTADLHNAAQCFVLFVDDAPAAFAGVLHRPHPKTPNLKGVARLVTLPDFQGLGLAFVLLEVLGGAYRAAGQYLHTYPAHPSLIRSMSRSPSWALRKRPGHFAQGSTGPLGLGSHQRPCAVFRFRGAANPQAAKDLLHA